MITVKIQQLTSREKRENEPRMTVCNVYNSIQQVQSREERVEVKGSGILILLLSLSLLY